MLEKILVVTPGNIPSTDITLHTLKYLENIYQIKSTTINQLDYREFFSGYQKLILLRQCDPTLSNYLLKLIELYKTKYIYYIDDNFWEIKDNTPLGKYYSDLMVQKTINRYMKNAQLVVAASENLYKYIKKNNPGVNVIYINAGFDFNLIAGLTQRKSTKIKILYAGSYYRENDFSVLITALKKIAFEFSEKIEIYFHGFAPKELRSIKNIFFNETIYSYDEFIKKQFQSSFDIGLAPIADTISNRAKSNLKYREYSACKIAGIYTNIPPYSDCIQNEVNGLLVEQTSESWYEAIKKLIINDCLRKQIIINAEKDVFDNYSNAVISKKWAAILSKVPNNKVSKFQSRKVIFFNSIKVLLIFISFLSRINRYYQQYGLTRTLNKIKKKLLKTSTNLAE